MKKLALLFALLLFFVPSLSQAVPAESRLRGKILLQVEENGEAWYVKPEDGSRMYMKDGAAAYGMMRDLGLGISNADLAKIPVGFEDRFDCLDTDSDGLCDKLEDGLGTDKNNPDTDGDGYKDGEEVRNNFDPLSFGSLSYDNNLANTLKGKILLQVETNGEAWYINPDDNKRYYMTDGQAAYQIMRFLSLGISNNDLDKIDINTTVTLHWPVKFVEIDGKLYMKASGTSTPGYQVFAYHNPLSKCLTTSNYIPNGLKTVDEQGYFEFLVEMIDPEDGIKSFTGVFVVAAISSDVDLNYYKDDCFTSGYISQAFEYSYDRQENKDNIDWQVYTNEEWNISFEYPVDWFYGSEESIGVEPDYFGHSVSIISSEDDAMTTPRFTVTVGGDGSGPYFNHKRLDIQKSEQGFEIIEEIKIDSNENQDNSRYFVIASNSNYVDNLDHYVLHFHMPAGDNDKWDIIIEGILNSFKF